MEGGIKAPLLCFLTLISIKSQEISAIVLVYCYQRRSGIMEWSDRMNASISYIEDNLAGEIDFNVAAEKAACSLFHFQRMFFAIIGVTPAEYTRRRRLTLAARELTTSSVKVIDVALKYGYDSPEAFSRAFRNVHGINPQAARTSGAKLAAFPRISFHIEIKGDNDMDYRIIEKPAFDVIGRSRRITPQYNGKSSEISQFWNEYMPSAEYKKLCEMTLEQRELVTGGHILGLFSPNENNTWDPVIMAICIEKSSSMDVTGFEVFHVPAASWAVFEIQPYSTQKHQEITRRVWSEWFPSTRYEHDLKPEIEAYFPAGIDKPPYKAETWYPIIKKK
jgi:AraC family transcriptional regulator